MPKYQKHKAGISKQKLRPLPKRLTYIYHILAIVIIIIPEWIAQAILSINHNIYSNEIKLKTSSWERHPELIIAAMTMKELRLTAKKFKLTGYAGESRETLTTRVFQILSFNFNRSWSKRE